MKKILFFLTLFFLPLPTHAENSIVGKWKDKTNPAYQYEFKKGQDFIFTYTWNNKGKTQTRISKGIWEIGVWTITSSIGTERECNLTIYADTSQCCFKYKFIADNLIMTNEFKSNSYDGMCKNRVLIREKKEGK